MYNGKADYRNIVGLSNTKPGSAMLFQLPQDLLDAQVEVVDSYGSEAHPSCICSLDLQRGQGTAEEASIHSHTSSLGNTMQLSLPSGKQLQVRKKVDMLQ